MFANSSHLRTQVALLRHAYENGVTHWDTAEVRLRPPGSVHAPRMRPRTAEDGCESHRACPVPSAGIRCTECPASASGNRRTCMCFVAFRRCCLARLSPDPAVGQVYTAAAADGSTVYNEEAWPPEFRGQKSL